MRLRARQLRRRVRRRLRLQRRLLPLIEGSNRVRHKKSRLPFRRRDFLLRSLLAVDLFLLLMIALEAAEESFSRATALDIHIQTADQHRLKLLRLDIALNHTTLCNRQSTRLLRNNQNNCVRNLAHTQRCAMARTIRLGYLRLCRGQDTTCCHNTIARSMCRW